MNWSLLIPIIAQEGLPLAEALFQKWTANTTPTQADFDELRALASQTAVDRVKARLAAAGIPLDDPKGKDLIALAGGLPQVETQMPAATPPATPPPGGWPPAGPPVHP